MSPNRESPKPCGFSFSSNITIADTDLCVDPLASQQAKSNTGDTCSASGLETPTLSNSLPPPVDEPRVLAASPSQRMNTPSQRCETQDPAQFEAELLAKINKLRADNAALRSVADQQAAAVDQLEKLSNGKQKVYKRLFSEEPRSPSASIIMQKDIMAKTHAEWKLEMERAEMELGELRRMRVELIGELEKRGISTNATILRWMAADVERAKEEEVRRQAATVFSEMRREKQQKQMQMQLADLEMDTTSKREEIERLEKTSRVDQ